MVWVVDHISANSGQAGDFMPATVTSRVSEKGEESIPVAKEDGQTMLMFSMGVCGL